MFEARIVKAKIGRGGLEMWIVTYGAGQDDTAHIARCAW